MLAVRTEDALELRVFALWHRAVELGRLEGGHLWTPGLNMIIDLNCINKLAKGKQCEENLLVGIFTR